MAQAYQPVQWRGRFPAYEIDAFDWRTRYRGIRYRRTGNLRAVQLLLGHKKIESMVRYLGIEVDDALAIAEQIDV